MNICLRSWILFASFVLYASLTQSQTIPPKELDSLIAKARASNSDGLVILQNGKVIVEEYFGQPLTPTYIASISKALHSMAIIKLLSDKKIKSIDQPVADFYPEWRQGQKQQITLRMLLSHTSGMQNIANSRLEIETGPQGAGNDLVKLALAAEIVDKPGSVYSYNNKATCLLGGIILQASGKTSDKYFEEEFFKPMGITNFEWKRDGAGTPQGHGGFRLLPMDLAKFGELMLNKGLFNNKRFFEERWVDSALKSSQLLNPNVGLIWHLNIKRNGTASIDTDVLRRLQNSNIADSIFQKLDKMSGMEFKTDSTLSTYLQQSFGSDWFAVLSEATKGIIDHPKQMFKTNMSSETLRSFYHTGSWGNYLVVIPGKKIVMVRLVKRDKIYNEQSDKFEQFMQIAMGLSQ